VILATAAKRSALSPAHQEGLYESMATLNALASRTAVELGVRCATDVTGFGLLGHLLHVTRASGVRVTLQLDAIPLLPGTREALAAGYTTGGAGRNAQWVDAEMDWNDSGEDWRALLSDPQTSGGLLIALAPELVAPYLAAVPGSVVIGHASGWDQGPRILIA
jgi:selenide,water dikinase